ncbi:putative toxin-antitoxin system toxin component, PIN family [Desulfonatronum thiosulfatophilum]|uniref:Putative toxin-antitoxin system toxin component, PIN family n=1 Tax=Desulfonatronum thiosulfatophilum TaxID=617002 RepID=A0A1G6DWJ9_9BACT|nr:putative toxin-antitoxin system toxin component, PIN family [Desulfonatronum thiosulfatophilum]SDB49145.1 putative toxin-antitoxin system toxin component, PIN family [Desulfonatronum thiosulfatophilum]
MTKAERFVIDSNVLISAALRASGPPAGLLEALHRSTAVLLFSHETQAELVSRLMKNKFDRYVSVPMRQRFLAQLDAVSEYVPIVNRPMGCRDPEDDIFLETAVNGNADCLITGDKDLLAMHPFQGIPILLPAQGLMLFFSG